MPDKIIATGGIELSEVKAQLEALEYFNSVQGILGAAEAYEQLASFNPPAAFVSVSNEAYQPNRYASGGHAQAGQSLISVLCCLTIESAAGDTTDEVDRVRKGVRNALKGFSVTGAQKPLDAVRYQVRLIDSGIVWFEWIFATSVEANGFVGVAP